MPKKTSPTGNRSKDRKRLKKQSPSILTPVLLIIFFVVAAVGVALYLKLSSTEGVRNQTSSINNSSTIASVLSTNGWTKGNGAAKAVLVEFGDFQCGACAAARLTI